MRHLLNLLRHRSQTINKQPAKRNTFVVLLLGQVVLNILLVLLASSHLVIVLVVFNLWFLVLSALAYRFSKSWFLQRFSHIKLAEQWATNYLHYNPEQQRVEVFNKGDWVVTDAIITLDEMLQRNLGEGFKTDKQEHLQAFLDAQTGIGNRIYFDHRIEAYLSGREEHFGGCVYLIQLGELDVVQAELGDIEVLELLNYFISLTSKFLEEHQESVFARRSEFDFALLIPNIGFKDAEKIASRLIRLCNRIPLPDVVDSDHFFHVGVASLAQSESAYQVLAEADMALRAAQLQGPSNWFMYDKGQIIKDLAKGSVQWRTAIDAALSQQAFVVLFQPVMLADNTMTHHHEILARMRNNNGQLVSAAVFLPMAQKFGMATRVDQLMVEKTVKLLDYDKTDQDICSLNLSIDSLLQVGFQNWLLAYLRAHAKVARRIIIELNEYALVTHGEHMVTFFRGLHKVGARMLVDQVGLYVLDTSYIRHYEVDYLKLHVSVVRNIDTRPENQLFIKSLLAACSGTHVLVFGLGVERIGEWVTLQKLGVAGAQGHYFTEPLESIHQISPSL